MTLADRGGNPVPPPSGPAADPGSAAVALLLTSAPAAAAGAVLLGRAAATADARTGRATFAGEGLSAAGAGFRLTARSGALRDAVMEVDVSGPGVAAELSPATPLLCANAACAAGPAPPPNPLPAPVIPPPRNPLLRAHT